MNIFYIPSWYPSKNNPIYGTFVKEQIELLANENPDWHLGISLWGQGDPEYMLWARDHLFNVLKLGNAYRKPYQKAKGDNVTEYFQPCLTWTRKITKGNLKGLFKTSEQNFNRFVANVGQVDIIHSQASYPGALIAQYLSEKFSIPFVVTIRMSPFPFREFSQRNGQLKTLIANPLQNANQLIATSRSLRNTLISYGLSNVSVVNNPVDTLLFHPTGTQHKDIRILSIGRLELQKGFDLLLQAVATIDIPIKIRIGGDGSQQRNLKKLAHSLKIEHKIEWLGRLSREQVAHEMQLCSFYVLSSRHETFGNVLLEAMACGKPMVATNCGGPADIVTTETGILCEAENISELGDAIARMCKEYQNFSCDVIRGYVESEFSAKAFSQKMNQIYKSAIAAYSR